MVSWYILDEADSSKSAEVNGVTSNGNSKDGDDDDDDEAEDNSKAGPNSTKQDGT